MYHSILTRPLRIAMIMAAGYGTRMNGLTDDLPKPLLPLNADLCILDVVLHKLARSGIERVVVNAHHHAELLEAHLGRGERYGLELILSPEPELLGSGGGIANAEKHFNDETILVVNADTLCDINLGLFFRDHRQHDALATMNVIPSRNTRDYSLCTFDDQFRLTGFLPRDVEIPEGQLTGIFTGHQILSPEARRYLRPQHQSVIQRFYSPALKEGRYIRTAPFDGEWIDVGTRDFYESLVRRIAAGEVDLNRFM